MQSSAATTGSRTHSQRILISCAEDERCPATTPEVKATGSPVATIDCRLAREPVDHDLTGVSRSSRVREMVARGVAQLLEEVALRKRHLIGVADSLISTTGRTSCPARSV